MGWSCSEVGQRGVKFTFYLEAKVSDADTVHLSFFFTIDICNIFLKNSTSHQSLNPWKQDSKESFQLLLEETPNRTQLFILDVTFDIGGGHAVRDY